MKANEQRVDKAELVRNAVLSCSHTIDAEEIVLRREPGQKGNALRQLSDRIAKALASHTEGAGAEPVAWCADHQIEGEYTRRYTAMKRVAEIWAEQGLTVTTLYASPTLPGDVVVVPRAAVNGLIERFAQIESQNITGMTITTPQELIDWMKAVAGYGFNEARAMIAAAPIPTPEGKVADADGWIEWKGGAQPLRDNTLIYWKLWQEGRTVECGPGYPKGLVWTHGTNGLRFNDIVAYRIVPPSSERGRWVQSLQLAGRSRSSWRAVSSTCSLAISCW